MTNEVLPTELEVRCRACGALFWRPTTLISGCTHCGEVANLVQTGRYQASTYNPHAHEGHAPGTTGRGTRRRRKPKQPPTIVRRGESAAAAQSFVEMYSVALDEWEAWAS